MSLYSSLITNEGTDTLTVEEENSLCLQAQQGNKSAIDKLLRSNLKFIAQKAHRALGNVCKPELFDDVVSAGIEGFLIGLKKYQPSLGHRLLTYAGYWIEERIKYRLYKKSLINKPVYKQKRHYRETHVAEPNINIQAYDKVYPDVVYMDNSEVKNQLKKILKAINIKYKLILLHHFSYLEDDVSKSDVCYLLGIKQFEYRTVVDFVLKDCVSTD